MCLRRMTPWPAEGGHGAKCGDGCCGVRIHLKSGQRGLSSQTWTPVVALLLLPTCTARVSQESASHLASLASRARRKQPCHAHRGPGVPWQQFGLPVPSPAQQRGCLISLAADHLVLVVLAGQDLQGGLDDAATQAQHQVQGGLCRPGPKGRAEEGGGWMGGVGWGGGGCQPCAVKCAGCGSASACAVAPAAA